MTRRLYRFRHLNHTGTDYWNHRLKAFEDLVYMMFVCKVGNKK